MTVTRLHHHAAPTINGLETTEVSAETMREIFGDKVPAPFAGMGLPEPIGTIHKENHRIIEDNQERLDHEAANPQTRTNYKGNF